MPAYTDRPPRPCRGYFRGCDCPRCTALDRFDLTDLLPRLEEGERAEWATLWGRCLPPDVAVTPNPAPPNGKGHWSPQ